MAYDQAFTERVRGFVFVDATPCDDRILAGWTALAHSFIGALPAKS